MKDIIKIDGISYQKIKKKKNVCTDIKGQELVAFVILCSRIMAFVGVILLNWVAVVSGILFICLGYGIGFHALDDIRDRLNNKNS